MSPLSLSLKSFTMYLNKSLKLFGEKNKKYQTADSTLAGTTAEVTTKLPKSLTIIFNPAIKITFPKIFLSKLSTAQMTNRDN